MDGYSVFQRLNNVNLPEAARRGRIPVRPRCAMSPPRIAGSRIAGSCFGTVPLCVCGSFAHDLFENRYPSRSSRDMLFGIVRSALAGGATSTPTRPARAIAFGDQARGTRLVDETSPRSRAAPRCPSARSPTARRRRNCPARAAGRASSARRHAGACGCPHKRRSRRRAAALSATSTMPPSLRIERRRASACG